MFGMVGFLTLAAKTLLSALPAACAACGLPAACATCALVDGARS